MPRAALALALLAAAGPAPLVARATLEASPPTRLAVTLYRDPRRGADEAMDRDWPGGFAMITERRTVTLPPGESTIRFEGVAEGMIAVSAIVTGLPGGTIEKNRDAELLSPASLVDGTLGNRVRVTRTDPATGRQAAEDAVVRTRADGGLVLQTREGFEAVRCAGLPETLTFDRVPAGLSAQPVFSVNTRDPRGGTYTVELTYLAWGFDWQANYVATLAEPGRGDGVTLRLMSWLTLLNDNGQSFADAELLVVAGQLSVVSDFEALADPPEAPPLALTCYPLGSTAAGWPIGSVVVSGYRTRGLDEALLEASSAAALEDSLNELPQFIPHQTAREEGLGDLKLYRVPERVTVSAKGLKQVAFLDRAAVEGRLLYKVSCSPADGDGEAWPASMWLETVNDSAHGLGVALPMGGIAVFEPSSFGDQLVAEDRVRDTAEGQNLEIDLGDSAQVFARCERLADFDHESEPRRWRPMRLSLDNANPGPVRVKLILGASGAWQVRELRGTRIKDGAVTVELTVPGNGRREVRWEVGQAGAT